MGYTHYWTFKKPSSKAMAQAMKDMGKIAKHFSSILAGGDGTGKPVISPSEITFNGIDDESHETFSVSNPPKSGFEFCKTAEKPYDEAVIACLAALKDSCKNQVDVSSDGGDSAIAAGAATASSILGHKVVATASLKLPCIRKVIGSLK